MDKISELLHYVQRTNPEMTREKLIEELSKSDYVARSINFTKENFLRAQKIFRNFFVPPWGSVFWVKIPFSRILKNV